MESSVDGAVRLPSRRGDRCEPRSNHSETSSGSTLEGLQRCDCKRNHEAQWPPYAHPCATQRQTQTLCRDDVCHREGWDRGQRDWLGCGGARRNRARRKIRRDTSKGHRPRHALDRLAERTSIAIALRTVALSRFCPASQQWQMDRSSSEKMKVRTCALAIGKSGLETQFENASRHCLAQWQARLCVISVRPMLEPADQIARHCLYPGCTPDFSGNSRREMSG